MQLFVGYCTGNR